MTVYVLEYHEFYSGHTVAVATSLERAQQLLREYVDTKNKFAAERGLSLQWGLASPNEARAHPDASVDDEAVEIFVYEADVLHGHKSSASGLAERECDEMTENERVESEEIQGGVITFPPNTVYLDPEAGILGRWDELDDNEGA